MPPFDVVPNIVVVLLPDLVFRIVTAILVVLSPDVVFHVVVEILVVLPQNVIFHVVVDILIVLSPDTFFRAESISQKGSMHSGESIDMTADAMFGLREDRRCSSTE